MPSSAAVQSANTALLLPSIHLPLVSNPETTLEVPNNPDQEEELQEKKLGENCWVDI